MLCNRNMFSPWFTSLLIILRHYPDLFCDPEGVLIPTNATADLKQYDMSRFVARQLKLLMNTWETNLFLYSDK